MSDERDDYLWDKSGEPDRDVARLEDLLARYRYDAARDRGLRVSVWKRPLVRGLSLAAGLLIGLGIWRGFAPREVPIAYEVAGLASVSRVAAGEGFETGSASATVRVGSIGHVLVDPSSRVRVEGIAEDAHRLFLERGSVTAKIYARPGAFQIGTPAGLSIDLGCEYELDVDDAGRSTMTVKTGRVAFEGAGLRVVVPAGATCNATSDAGPNVPVRISASDDFVAAVRRIERASEPDARDVERVLAEDAKSASVTLWHLFTNAASQDLSARAATQLASAYPPPNKSSPRDLRDDPEARDAWLATIQRSWGWYGE